MSSAYERNLTNELLEVKRYLEQENRSKVLSTIRQVFRILETQPASVELESVVSAYLSLVSYFLRTNVESLSFTTHKAQFHRFLFEESALGLETLAAANLEESPETVSHFYASIPVFLDYLNKHLFLETDMHTVGTSTYYPEQGRLVLKNNRKIFLNKSQNLIFRLLLKNKNEILEYGLFLDGDDPLFSSKESFQTTLKNLRTAIRPLENEMRIVTVRRDGIYLHMGNTE